MRNNIAETYSAAREAIINHYDKHRTLYNNIIPVGCAVVAGYAAKEGLDYGNVQQYVADSLTFAQDYADNIGRFLTYTSAGLTSAVPAKLFAKYAIGQRKKHDGARGASETIGVESTKEIVSQIAEQAAGESISSTVAEYALGLPLAPTDVRDIYRGVRSEFSKSKDKIAPSYEDDKQVDKLIEDLGLEKPTGTVSLTNYRSIEKAENYVDLLKESMEEKGYPF